MDKDDPLWDLLGKAPAPKIDPRFVAEMRQRVAGESQEQGGWFQWLGRWTSPTVAALACALVLAVVSVAGQFGGSTDVGQEDVTLAMVSTEDEAQMMVALLPELLAMQEESSLLQAIDESSMF
jgi:hypothetical protein